MASGHVNRTQRPNTWLHRPTLRREDSPCQLGAVHTWPLNDKAPFSGRPSLTGHCGHGWTCSLPRPVAIDPISEVEGASQQSRPCRFLQRRKSPFVLCPLIQAATALGICRINSLLPWSRSSVRPRSISAARFPDDSRRNMSWSSGNQSSNFSGGSGSRASKSADR